MIALPGVTTDRRLALDATVLAALADHAPVAIGVSGGKDSCAVAIATLVHLDRIGHRGARLLIHSDLGAVEWRQSLPHCRLLARRLGLELAVVRRGAGDLLQRWRQRWQNCRQRYRDLLCVKLILPWSTASMRFCTAELKRDVICSELRRRFPGQTILSVSGIRREESSRRRQAPVSKAQPKLGSRSGRGWDWHPILDWTAQDVYDYLAEQDFPLHEAYTRYGNSRVSCAFCILGSRADLAASATCADNAAIYRQLVDLEIASTFAFQGHAWPGEVAPRLLTPAQRDALAIAQNAGRQRQLLEAQIPPHLLYTKGWPTCVPTAAEAALLCRIRRGVGRLVGLDVRYTTPAALQRHYRNLLEDRP